MKPWACKLVGMVEQTEEYNFYIKGQQTNKKFQLVKPGAQLSIMILYDLGNCIITLVIGARKIAGSEKSVVCKSQKKGLLL